MRKRELHSMLIIFSQKCTWLSKAASVNTPSKPPSPSNFFFSCVFVIKLWAKSHSSCHRGSGITDCAWNKTKLPFKEMQHPKCPSNTVDNGTLIACFCWSLCKPLILIKFLLSSHSMLVCWESLINLALTACVNTWWVWTQQHLTETESTSPLQHFHVPFLL